MKKIISMLISLLVVTAMTCGLSISAYAAGTVTYSANSNRFIFAPGSNHSPTDLFTEYKGLMPGDSIRQDITVRNDESHNVKVKLYVRSRGAQKNTEEFLSKLHLTVAKAENNEMAYMFDASADQTDGMTDWVYLGTLYSGGEVNLVLNLDIPIDLSNEFQDAIGYIDWEFKVEEFPVDPDDPQPPQTGDNSNLFLYAMLASISGIALIILISMRRKEKGQQ